MLHTGSLKQAQCSVFKRDLKYCCPFTEWHLVDGRLQTLTFLSVVTTELAFIDSVVLFIQCGILISDCNWVLLWRPMSCSQGRSYMCDCFLRQTTNASFCSVKQAQLYTIESYRKSCNNILYVQRKRECAHAGQKHKAGDNKPTQGIKCLLPLINMLNRHTLTVNKEVTGGAKVSIVV